jgi:hypothetical protein
MDRAKKAAKTFFFSFSHSPVRLSYFGASVYPREKNTIARTRSITVCRRDNQVMKKREERAEKMCFVYREAHT